METEEEANQNGEDVRASSQTAHCFYLSIFDLCMDALGVQVLFVIGRISLLRLEPGQRTFRAHLSASLNAVVFPARRMPADESATRADAR